MGEQRQDNPCANPAVVFLEEGFTVWWNLVGMKKLRWAMDGGFWELDASTPISIDGVARPVPGNPLPLGMSRGARLSRPKQIDFFQRFMSMPFVPSYASPAAAPSPHGFYLQRVLTFPFGEYWFTLNLHKICQYNDSYGN